MEHAPATLALIGVGRMGAVHAQAIARHLPDVTLAAIAEPRAAAVEALGDARALPPCTPRLRRRSTTQVSMA